MESRVLVAQAVERRSELLLEREQRGFGLFLGAFRRLVREVELRAVAGRETHGLAGLAGKRPGQLGRTLGIESRALPQLNRRLMVRDADEDDAHVAKWVAGKARRTVRRIPARYPPARRAIQRFPEAQPTRLRLGGRDARSPRAVW